MRGLSNNGALLLTRPLQVQSEVLNRPVAAAKGTESALPRLRVLHVVPVMAKHGAETVVYRLTAGSDVDHEIICLGRRDTYSAIFENAGIRVTHLNMGPTDIAALPRLFSSVRKSGAQVVQCWMYRANLLGGLAARLAGIPVVWNIRCSSIAPLRPGSRLLAYLGGALARWIPDAIVNCSGKSAELHDRFGYGRAEGVVIPNGYDSADFSLDDAARARTRTALGIGPGDFVVGTIARWHPQKGIPVFMRAIQQLRERNIPVRAILLGRGMDDANPELARLVQQSGCAEAVQLLGERSDVRDIARSLDLHVLASIGSEGFPNVVAETMLSGTPNVVTDVGDSALIVGDTGWIVVPADAAALADAIEAAYKQHASAPEEWARRRDSARERIVENFSLERMIRAYEGVWQKVAGTAVQELQ